MLLRCVRAGRYGMVLASVRACVFCTCIYVYMYAADRVQGTVALRLTRSVHFSSRHEGDMWSCSVQLPRILSMVRWE
jgi:hypothetical protein